MDREVLAAMAEYVATSQKVIADLLGRLEEKGDVAGHEFHGNRWTGGLGGSGNLPFNVHGDQYFSALNVKGQAYVRAQCEKFGVTPDAIAKEIESRLRNPDGSVKIDVIAEGAKWYPMAHEVTVKVSESTQTMPHPVSPEIVATVLAELSPQTPWATNVEVGARLSQWYASGKGDGLTPEQATLAFKAQWQQEGWGGKTKGSGYTENAKLAMMNGQVTQALEVLTGSKTIEESLTSPKQRSFANNIMLPGQTRDVTVDVMMQKAITFSAKDLLPKDPAAADESGQDRGKTVANFFQGKSVSAAAGAGYVTTAAGTRIAADRLGISPDVAQAAYWIQVQDITPPGWPRSTGATMPNMATPLVTELLGHPFIGTENKAAHSQGAPGWPLSVDYGTQALTEAETMTDDEVEAELALEDSEVEVEQKGDVSGHEFHGNRYTGGIGDPKSFISEHFGNWHENLTKPQEVALAFYQSPGYELMNGILRGESPKAPAKDLSRARTAITNLSAAIATAPPIKHDVVAYRGMSQSQFDLKPGETVREPGFTSTALDKNAASVSGSGEQILAEIRIPSGARVGAGYSRELILPSDSSFRVVSASGGRPVLEYIPKSAGELELKYSDDEPRDDHGRWTSGGDSGDEAPTRVSTIDEAIALLGDGKGIMFERPDQAVTLLHRLAQMANEAKAAGRQAKAYDLCKVSVTGTNLFCSENVGIPREAMPQLIGKPTPGSPADSLPKNAKGEVDLGQAFRDSLTAGGNMIIDTNEFASHLRASQTEMDGTKVGGMMEAMQAGKIPPAAIFVSDDNYIVDGHHRWAANVGLGLGDKREMSMPVARVDMKILPLLSAANHFADAMGIPQAGLGKGAIYLVEWKGAEWSIKDAKGDVVGHGFHGNRYTGGIGGGEKFTVFPPEKLMSGLSLRVKQTTKAFDKTVHDAITHYSHELPEAATLKADVVHNLAAATGLAPDRANQMIKTWALSSTDSEPDSVALQMAAAEKFGVDPGQYLKGQSDYMSGGYRSALEAGPPPPRMDVDSAGRLMGENEAFTNQTLGGHLGNADAMRTFDAAVEMSQKMDATTSFVVPREYFVPTVQLSEHYVQTYGTDLHLPFPGFGTNVYDSKEGWVQMKLEDGSVRFTRDNSHPWPGAGDQSPKPMGWDQRMSDATRAVGAIYDHTQSVLAASGVKEMTVFRGMNWDSDHADPVTGSIPPALRDLMYGGGIPENVQAGLSPPSAPRPVTVSLNPLSSFSVNSFTSQQFGGGTHGLVFGVTVPANRILSLASTGPGSLREGEVVVIGGPLAMHGGQDDVRGVVSNWHRVLPQDLPQSEFYNA